MLKHIMKVASTPGRFFADITTAKKRPGIDCMRKYNFLRKNLTKKILWNIFHKKH